MAVVNLALALVLLMTSFSTVEMSTDATRRLSRKPHPHLQPLSPGGYRTYIVILEAPTGDMDYAAHRAWHESFLPTKMTRDGQRRLLRSYTTVVNGFSALLTDEEVKRVAEKQGFIRAIPNAFSYKQTTRTPAFLGLGTGPEPSPTWTDANYGSGVIIGVVDTGIDADHTSLIADGLPSPPPRWKGSCQGFDCTNKLIGGKNFIDHGDEPEDEVGHGTHTATTAAGNQLTDISINYNGLANGTASGMAPSAHIAVYKVCGIDVEVEDGCPNDAILDGIDAAVADGVDVITISLGLKSEVTYDHNPVAIGAYSAMKKGIPVVASAGNDGPLASSVLNDIPWLITVAAGTVDRNIQAKLLLGVDADHPILGESIGGDWRFGAPPSPSVGWSSLLYADEGDRRYCVYPDNELKDRIRDKIVICDSEPEPLNKTQGDEIEKLLLNNASGVILIGTELDGYAFELINNGPRVIQIAYDEQYRLKDYASSPMATGSIELGGTVLGFTPAPLVAGFSARGPSRLSPGILKPDVLAPGVNILAGVPYGGDSDVDFVLMSGTSMSTPHVAGLVALLKKSHPDWSPAAVKSALMTTADILDNTGKPILDQHRATADFYATGAGHVNLSRALDPGLVYEIAERDYATYLCSTLGEDAHRVISRGDKWNCGADLWTTVHQSNLNYPTIIVPLHSSVSPFVLLREVTNVAPLDEDQPESYTINVEMPSEVRVTVQPSSFNVTYPGQLIRYSLTVSSYATPVDGGVYQGSVTLTSSKHTVRSRMIAVVGLASPQPSTGWNI